MATAVIKNNNNIKECSLEGETFKNYLKKGLRTPKNDEEGWKVISELENIVNNSVISNQILGIQMILSHSKAEDVFLEFHKLRENRLRQRGGGSMEEKERIQNLDQPKVIEHLEYDKMKTQLLKVWLSLVKSFCKISKETGTENDKKILENSIPYLMQMYSATLGESDRQIFSILKTYTSKNLRIELESMPLFGPKCFHTSVTQGNPLFAHSIRANTVLGCLNEKRAFETAFKFDEELFLSEEWLEGHDGDAELGQTYDLRFLIPLVCHILDEKNICDVVKVITNGWIYFIARGLGMRDKALRNTALLAFKRLIFNLHLAKGFRLQDVKIWLHFLLGVKSGFLELSECKVSPLVATWIIAACKVLKQPAHPLFPKLTHFLLAKPTIDLSILPDFTNFFNAEDGNRESRDWMLNILSVGLKGKEDWAIAKKVPTIKFMCSLFLLEKIQPQRIILKILAGGAKIPQVAHDLVDRHGLLLWIANMKLDEKTFYRRELQDVYKNLSLACPAGGYRDSMFQLVATRHNWEYIRDQYRSNLIVEEIKSELVDVHMSD